MIFKKKGNPFAPDEIIFSVTEACNLNCKHCYVSKSPKKLEIEAAVTFLKSCISSNSNTIEKIGFSGGEPFLNLQFILEISKFAVENELLFDQITTNGDWWKTEEELHSTLQTLFDAGYDGKICLSWDAFHNQTVERMKCFIENVETIFGAGNINIQCCIPKNENSDEVLSLINKTESVLSYLDKEFPEISVYKLPQCFQSSDLRGWKAKKWFTEDFCQGPGNILFVHPDGNVAPCCGFANENKSLFLGKINDGFDNLMQNATKNPMIQLCYEKGLSSLLKKREIRKLLPGKTDDICNFCDFVMKLSKSKE